MKEKRYLFSRLCAAVLLAAVGLSGCSMTAAPPPDRVDGTVGDYWKGIVIDPQKGYQVTVESAFSNGEMARAEEALREAGVISGEPREWGEAVSRAEFICLLIRALGEDPAPLGLPGESWYAPYIRTGYELGLFADSAQAMTFTPASGFLLGDKGWPPMDEQLCRYDAAALLAPLLSGEGTVAFSDEDSIPEALKPIVHRGTELFPPLLDGAFHGDGPVSWGHSLVCAQRVMEGHKPLPGPAETQPLGEVLAQGRIVHAGGRVAKTDGRAVGSSNSAEAVLNAYRAGERVLEIDFNWTSDGELVCIHDWGSRFSSQITEGQALSLEEWKKARIYGELTPLTLESLAVFLREHPDLYVVTDVKEGNVEAAGRIVQTCPDLLERFVIQIYREEEYEPVAALGFPFIIFTLYDLPQREKLDTGKWADFAAGHPLTGYTYPVELMNVEGYTEAMRRIGLPLFVHTVNGSGEIQNCYDRGITAVYTDDVLGQ